jgi:hypothetical protein
MKNMKFHHIFLQISYHCIYRLLNHSPLLYSAVLSIGYLNQ